MSGNDESKTPTIDEKHGEIQRMLRDYPEEIGLGVLKPINDTNRFMTMSIAEQRKLTAEECGEASIILNQSATYIQLAMNKLTADIYWCNTCIDWLIAHNVMSYGTQYTPFEYRKILAIRGNDVAEKLRSLIVQMELRIQELGYMPNKLISTADAFSKLQQTKRSQRI